MPITCMGDTKFGVAHTHTHHSLYTTTFRHPHSVITLPLPWPCTDHLDIPLSPLPCTKTHSNFPFHPFPPTSLFPHNPPTQTYVFYSPNLYTIQPNNTHPQHNNHNQTPFIFLHHHPQRSQPPPSRSTFPQASLTHKPHSKPPFFPIELSTPFPPDTPQLFCHYQ